MLLRSFSTDRICQLLTLIVVFIAVSSFPVSAQPLDSSIQPVGGERKELWYQALGPDHSDVVKTWNDLPMYFNYSSGRARAYEKALIVLKKSERKIENYHPLPYWSIDPDEVNEDLVDTYCNLGSFYFLRQNYGMADQYVSKAVSAQLLRSPRDSIKLAPLYDYKGTIARASGKYDEAEKDYQDAYKIRRNHFREWNSDTARSATMLAMNSFDKSGGPFDQSDWFNGLDREQPRRSRPVGDVLGKMVEFANYIISKYTPPIRERHSEEGWATILGNWSIATDVSDVTQIKEKKSQETIQGETFDVTEKREEKAKPFQNVPIYLCHYPDDKDAILRRLERFGTDRGVTWPGLGQMGTLHGWPANHRQALQVQEAIDNEVKALQMQEAIDREVKGLLPVSRTEVTDANGDYIFKDVPEGNYVLYASLCTKKKLEVWIIPPPPIDVRRKRAPIEVRKGRREQFWIDFREVKGKVLWEDGHPSAPQTPSEYFQGSAVERRDPGLQAPQGILVPPPPPSKVPPNVLQQIEHMRNRK